MAKKKKKEHQIIGWMHKIDKGWHSITLENRAMFKLQIMLVTIAVAVVIWVGFYAINRQINLEKASEAQMIKQVQMLMDGSYYDL
jgi:hypothetical protein